MVGCRGKGREGGGKGTDGTGRGVVAATPELRRAGSEVPVRCRCAGWGVVRGGAALPVLTYGVPGRSRY